MTRADAVRCAGSGTEPAEVLEAPTGARMVAGELTIGQGRGVCPVCGRVYALRVTDVGRNTYRPIPVMRRHLATSTYRTDRPR